jgi:hypothetical protein
MVAERVEQDVGKILVHRNQNSILSLGEIINFLIRNARELLFFDVKDVVAKISQSLHN